MMLHGGSNAQCGHGTATILRGNLHASISTGCLVHGIHLCLLPQSALTLVPVFKVAAW